MAWLTSTNLLASHVLYTLVLAYVLLSDPQTLARQNLILTLGSSLRLPRASSSAWIPPGEQYTAERTTPDVFAAPNAGSAFAALLLAFYALNNAVGASLPEPCFGVYWTSQSMGRLAVLFGLEAWIYLSKPAINVRPAASGLSTHWATFLKNDIVFTWAFVELIWMFWVFYLLRDERRQYLASAEQRRKRTDEGVSL